MTRHDRPRPRVQGVLRLGFLLLFGIILLGAFMAILGRTTPSHAAAYAGLTGEIPAHDLPLPDGTLAYDDQGSGPLVIMIPGLGDLRQEYRLVAPQLVAAGYRVVTVDLRGHGGSSVGWPDYGSSAAGEDLLALVRHLDAGPAVVVGNSFGAAPAVWAAAERPDAFAGLTLVGPFVRDHDTSPVMKAAMRVMFSGPWRVAAWNWYYGTLFPTRKPADFDTYRAALRGNLAEPGRFEAVQAMLRRSDAEIALRLPRVQAPSLVLMGTKDPDFPDPAAEADWIASQLRGEARMIEGAGHYPQTEMPEITVPILLDFLQATHRAS